jgi:3',5'-cyclic AMP phosphodiesterase CpdA
MEVLATFVQISDLHIGELSPDGEAPLPPFVHVHPRFDGQFGHSYLALKQLDKFWHSEARQAQAILVVTGDLTAFGAAQQFANADDFIARGLAAHHNLGLRTPDWRERAISGNHDQWPGPGILGPSSRALHAFLGSFPQHAVHPVSASMRIRLLRIDTDAQVGAFGADRFLARGRFSDQIAALRAQLPATPPAGEVRVLLMHHSPSWQQRVCGISSTSRSKLLAFLADYGVRVVMTGHTHQPMIRPLEEWGLPRVLETCCGTTTQRTELPKSLPAPLRQGRRHTGSVNTLIWHQIVVDAGKTEWRARAYPRSEIGGYKWGPVRGVGYVEDSVVL